ncbi:MAG: ThuA domain-containing protein [Sedimentisphaerales bacterium]|nr:ThuA domain-containing protein [Sedimentisphaerales bacterium]
MMRKILKFSVIVMVIMSLALISYAAETGDAGTRAGGNRRGTGMNMGMGRGTGMGLGGTRGQQQSGPTEEEIKKMEEAMPTKAVVEPAKPRKLLVIDILGQGAFPHTSIPYWNKALQIMGEKTGAFTAVVSSDINMFSAENLAQFDAVCLNNSVSLPLSPTNTPELCKALMDFVKGGKGIMAIHAGTDAFYTGANVWPEASEMLGGKFSGHPWTAGRNQWAVKIDEPDHPLMAPFQGKGFKLVDEIYRTEPPLYSRDKQLVLMSLDMSDETTKGVRGQKPTDIDTGISWIKNWEKGRVFYCSLGHEHAVTWTAPILEHYLRGIQFALGDLKADATPKPLKK